MGLATPEGNNWRKTKIKGGHAAVKIYLSQDWFLKFLNGDENASEYEGFYNEGESWIFLPLPGTGMPHFEWPGKERKRICRTIPHV